MIDNRTKEIFSQLSRSVADLHTGARDVGYALTAGTMTRPELASNVKEMSQALAELVALVAAVDDMLGGES